AAGARTPYQYVRAVEAYLAKGFSYSENPPRRAVPLASFLLADRTGYCQQFSGAMALLLRMGGVPARVATGFAPGGYNRARGEYVVRDDDAHSWVEVYFQPYGWVPFDPTPVAAPPASQAPFGSAASAGAPDPRDTAAGRRRVPGSAARAPVRRGRAGPDAGPAPRPAPRARARRGLVGPRPGTLGPSAPPTLDLHVGRLRALPARHRAARVARLPRRHR